jgi:S1-C subfamily serine protease
VCAAGCGGGGKGHRTPARPDPPSAGQQLNLGVAAIDALIGGDVESSSGIVLDGSRGLVLTSAHSIWGATSMRVTTGVGIVYGRIVARAPCDDLALVETEPRIPGLVALRPAPGAGRASGDVLRAIGRQAAHQDVSSLNLINIPLLRDPAALRQAVARAERAKTDIPRPREAIALQAPLIPAVSGGPLLDRASRLVGMSVATDEGQGFAVPWKRIEQRLSELKAGPRRVYVGWRAQYRCVGVLNRYAKASHPGFRPLDARLNAPVPATRLPGTAKSLEG